MFGTWLLAIGLKTAAATINRTEQASSNTGLFRFSEYLQKFVDNPVATVTLKDFKPEERWLVSELFESEHDAPIEFELGYNPRAYDNYITWGGLGYEHSPYQ